VVVATLIAPLQIWVRGQRWWYLFPPGSNPPPLTPAMMIGYMANNVLPLRAGEVVRIYVVARRWSAAGLVRARRMMSLAANTRNQYVAESSPSEKSFA